MSGWRGQRVAVASKVSSRRLSTTTGCGRQELKYVDIGGPDTEFRFVIRQTEAGAAELAAPTFGGPEPVYVARRDGPHGVVVKTPSGTTTKIALGGAGERGVVPNARLTFSDSSMATTRGPEPDHDVAPAGTQGSSDWYDDI